VSYVLAGEQTYEPEHVGAVVASAEHAMFKPAPRHDQRYENEPIPYPRRTTLPARTSTDAVACRSG
jgi:hypothetical protein